jgi:transcriptional regulator of acetoin/glycerol metabolism
VEEAAILDALETSGGNVSQAARLLGLSRQHLHTRIKRLDLRDRMPGATS